MSKLTIESAKAAICKIKKIMYDDEAAHSKEDKIYARFILEVSEGLHTHQEAKDIAKELIKSKNLNFSRWCA